MDEKINNEQQELFLKLNFFDQSLKHLQEQLHAVKSGISDLGILNKGLDDIKDLFNNKDNAEKEILAPLGRGIFVKAKLTSDDLIVNVGDKNFVKKDVPQTKEILGNQLKKLEEVQKELEEKIEETDKNLNELLSQVQKMENI